MRILVASAAALRNLAGGRRHGSGADVRPMKPIPAHVTALGRLARLRRLRGFISCGRKSKQRHAGHFMAHACAARRLAIDILNAADENGCPEPTGFSLMRRYMLASEPHGGGIVSDNCAAWHFGMSWPGALAAMPPQCRPPSSKIRILPSIMSKKPPASQLCRYPTPHGDDSHFLRRQPWP